MPKFTSCIAGIILTKKKVTWCEYTVAWYLVPIRIFGQKFTHIFDMEHHDIDIPISYKSSPYKEKREKYNRSQ